MLARGKAGHNAWLVGLDAAQSQQIVPTIQQDLLALFQWIHAQGGRDFDQRRSGTSDDINSMSSTDHRIQEDL